MLENVADEFTEVVHPLQKSPFPKEVKQLLAEIY